ncbi:TolC family protein [Mangrovibacterium marinum]|uniref:Outer membrane protein TolC n=1 Tax=Mangrovibacterium marinum TaxID=1639118 RepID=A0A2T5C1K8_9BACT|nr:TolC family protein [Mangrovibacterium marinum]PTN08504.1 outer membrane protein TolC [Mangrovibacterium marinum]
MKLSVILFFQFLLIVSGGAVVAQSLSYGQARDLMIRNNKKLQSLDKQLESDEYVRKQAGALRLPDLKLTGMAVRLDEDLGLDLNEKRDQLSQLLQLPSADVLGNWNFVMQQKSFWTVSMNLNYPLFTGGKINAAVNAADYKSQIKQSEVTKEQNGLLTALTTRYFQLQLANEAVVVRGQAVDAAKHHWEDARKLEKNGMAATVERMQAEAAFADAQRELMAARKDADLARTALLGVLGVDSIPDELTTPLFTSPQLQVLADYEGLAVQYYPDINKLFLMQELSEQGLKAKKAAYVPDVALMGNYELLSGNVAEIVPKWFAGVGVSFTLFDGMSRKNEIREYSATKQSISLMKEQAQQDIRVLVRKQYQALEKNAEQLVALEKDVAFAEELLRIREKAFVEGFGKSVDVVDANLYLSAIRLKRVQALYEYDITLAALLETCGQSDQFETYIPR